MKSICQAAQSRSFGAQLAHQSTAVNQNNNWPFGPLPAQARGFFSAQRKPNPSAHIYICLPRTTLLPSDGTWGAGVLWQPSRTMRMKFRGQRNSNTVDTWYYYKVDAGAVCRRWLMWRSAITWVTGVSIYSVREVFTFAPGTDVACIVRVPVESFPPAMLLIDPLACAPASRCHSKLFFRILRPTYERMLASQRYSSVPSSVRVDEKGCDLQDRHRRILIVCAIALWHLQFANCM